MKNYFFNSNIYIYQKEAKWKTADINTVRKVLKTTKTIRNGLTIRLSNDKDIKVFNGLDMFIYQGQKSFYLWNKINPEIDQNLIELLLSKLK